MGGLPALFHPPGQYWAGGHATVKLQWNRACATLWHLWGLRTLNLVFAVSVGGVIAARLTSLLFGGEQNWWLSNNPVLLFSPEKAELCGGISQKVWAMFGKPITRGTPQHCHLASRFLFLPLLIRISRCFSTECSGFRWAQAGQTWKSKLRPTRKCK